MDAGTHRNAESIAGALMLAFADIPLPEASADIFPEGEIAGIWICR
jgi:hypothetical protein